MISSNRPLYPLVMDVECDAGIITPEGASGLFFYSGTNGKLTKVVAIGLSRSAVNKWLDENPGHKVMDHWGGLDLIACPDS